MKRIVFLILFFVPSLLIGQPIFNAGIKAGLNNSKVTFRKSEYSSESIIKTHIGAFARVGFGNFYLQPEAYFSAKGGEVLERGHDASERAAKFNFNNIDVPLLLGLKIINGEKSNVRIMVGPVFNFLASKDLDADGFFSKEYLRNSYCGYQYGIGVDLWSFFLDARMENAINDVYSHRIEGVKGKNQTFMLTLGFKIF